MHYSTSLRSGRPARIATAHLVARGRRRPPSPFPRLDCIVMRLVIYTN